ncbi:MAG: M20/M25/M40 family metallo-hydrolase [Streptococcaceae bacterium]|jgi:acetylornithine deacetylase|nr:M20/M25/M40 family metallo-hydrolase [Streptococcaceae bacterium]
MSEVVDLAAKLVSIPSVSGDEEAILVFLASWMQEKKFAAIVKTDTFVAGKIAGSAHSQAVILSGHIDTVSAGNRADWAQSPWEPVVSADRIVGLGISDMKAGVAGNLSAAASLSHEELPFDVWVAGTANEELDGQGSANFAAWFDENTAYDATVCVISEPTDLSQIKIGQRGSHFMTFIFHGTAGHASVQAHYAVSALAKAEKFLAALDEITKKLTAYDDAALGLPTMVPTSIESGNPETPNKTADKATLIVDFRTNPAFEAVFDSFIGKLAADFDFDYKDVATPVLATLTDGDAGFIKHLQEVTGVAELSVSQGSNDQGFFEAIGVPTVIYGPGADAQAHKTNEFALTENLNRHVAQLTEFLAAYGHLVSADKI